MRTKQEIIEMNPARFNTANPQDAMDMELHYIYKIEKLEALIDNLYSMNKDKIKDINQLNDTIGMRDKEIERLEEALYKANMI